MVFKKSELLSNAIHLYIYRTKTEETFGLIQLCSIAPYIITLILKTDIHRFEVIQLIIISEILCRIIIVVT